MQAAGGDVRPAAELAARVQLGGDQLDAGEPALGLLVGRDAAPVVLQLVGAVGEELDQDVLAVGHEFEPETRVRDADLRARGKRRPERPALRSAV